MFKKLQSFWRWLCLRWQFLYEFTGLRRLVGRLQTARLRLVASGAPKALTTESPPVEAETENWPLVRLDFTDRVFPINVFAGRSAATIWRYLASNAVEAERRTVALVQTFPESVPRDEFLQLRPYRLEQEMSDEEIVTALAWRGLAPAHQTHLLWFMLGHIDACPNGRFLALGDREREVLAIWKGETESGSPARHLHFFPRGPKQQAGDYVLAVAA